MRLEQRDLTRDRRHRDAEAFGRAGEAAGLDHTGERADGVKAVHDSGDYCIERNSLLMACPFIPF